MGAGGLKVETYSYEINKSHGVWGTARDYNWTL